MFEGLQPTYEGLKPDWWNRIVEYAARFAAYLRGIETPSRLKWQMFPKRVCSLPTRD